MRYDLFVGTEALYLKMVRTTIHSPELLITGERTSSDLLPRFLNQGDFLMMKTNITLTESSACNL